MTGNEVGERGGGGGDRPSSRDSNTGHPKRNGTFYDFN